MMKEENKETESDNNGESDAGEENNENADQDSEDNNNKEDPTEQILIEQDFEFIPSTWYRVVIEFKQYKFRVQVKEEFYDDAPEIDDEPLSRTTQYIELQKKEFYEAFEPGIPEGRLGFFCNMCKGVQVSFVNAFN